MDLIVRCGNETCREFLEYGCCRLPGSHIPFTARRRRSSAPLGTRAESNVDRNRRCVQQADRTAFGKLDTGLDALTHSRWEQDETPADLDGFGTSAVGGYELQWNEDSSELWVIHSTDNISTRGFASSCKVCGSVGSSSEEIDQARILPSPRFRGPAPIAPANATNASVATHVRTRTPSADDRGTCRRTPRAGEPRQLRLPCRYS